MLNKIKHSLRFKLTMLLVVMMILTIFGSLVATQLVARKFFLSELRNRMIDMYQDVNQVFATDGLTDEEIREHLSRLAADGEINLFVLRADGVIFSNTNEKSKMWDSMNLIAII